MHPNITQGGADDGYAHTINGMAIDPRVKPLADRLVEALGDKGVSQAEVERRLGWSKRHLSKILNGRIKLRVDHVYDILEAADFDANEFFLRVAGQRAAGALERRVSELEAAVRETLLGRVPPRGTGDAEKPPPKRGR